MNERAIDSLARNASMQQARRDILKSLSAAALVAVAAGGRVAVGAVVAVAAASATVSTIGSDVATMTLSSR